jgi:hypothetical protein
MADNLYDLASIAGLKPGRYVEVAGPYDRWGQVQASIGKNEGPGADFSFAERYLIRGRGDQGPVSGEAPFAAN